MMIYCLKIGYEQNPMILHEQIESVCVKWWCCKNILKNVDLATKHLQQKLNAALIEQPRDALYPLDFFAFYL